MAACLALGPETVASHRSAAYLLDLDGIDNATVEVSVPANGRSHLNGAVVHRVKSIPRCDRGLIRGIPITNASRTLIDLDAVVKEETLELAVEDVLRRRITSVARLEWRLNDLCSRGRGGCGSLRHLLDQRVGDGPTENPLETKLTRAIRKSSLPKPRRQFEVKDGASVVARVDFAYPHERIAVEADGFRWHTSRPDWERDLQRRNDLQRLDWILIHVTDNGLRRGSGAVVAEIEAALRLRGASLFDEPRGFE